MSDGLLGYGTAADERSANLSVDVPVVSHFVAPRRRQLVEERRSADRRPYPVQGSARAGAPPARSRNPGAGRLEGRACPTPPPRAWELAGGLAYVDGAAQCRRLGHPPRRALRRADPLLARSRRSRPRPRRIDVKQTRYDARAEIPLSAASSARSALRGGYAKYRHHEIEDTGEIASTFFTQGRRGPRSSWSRPSSGGWGGTSGVQYLDRKVHIDGEEKFLPDSRQRQAGLFTHAEPGARAAAARRRARGSSSASLTAEADADLGTPARKRNFTTFSARPAAAYEFSPGWRAGVNLVAQRRARRRSRNCSPTARMPAPRRSRSAIPTSTPNGACRVEASIRNAPPARSA